MCKAIIFLDGEEIQRCYEGDDVQRMIDGLRAVETGEIQAHYLDGKQPETVLTGEVDCYYSVVDCRHLL